ncbi:unnamed protein product [Cladocopium goreaui]|uniref:Proteasome assembly chaperone 4 n=1 Tax=Cladocopium goreaui TaxID=2562237 RepID=A0A9P1GCS2_9DINO|nr:unnamed protein product [Cladocopium goreaui]
MASIEPTSNSAPSAPAPVAPKIVNSSCLCGGQVLHFHLMQLDGQIFLWIGGEKLGLDDLHVALPTRFDSLPSVASLRGEVDGNASSLSQKLSRRFGLMVFLSLNVPDIEGEMMKESTRILKDLLEPSA